jgi:hypothetical protein
MSSIEGAFIVSKNTTEGNGSPCAVDLASRYACSFSPLGIFFTEKPSKEASIFWTVSRYFLSFGSLALLLLSMRPIITCESDLRIACPSYSHCLKLSKPQEKGFIHCNVICAAKL